MYISIDDGDNDDDILLSFLQEGTYICRSSYVWYPPVPYSVSISMVVFHLKNKVSTKIKIMVRRQF